ncbi:Hypothetical predicted protein [Mytilus galloprovincialis]|uniref:Death domain-containing protein n=1 Tax=Mytilus galloprovincialis TaxID=29158 RepID=A0A8B6H1B1_MYTGA|nr:Hypothetical predicted protein [Mytilus galloprovincialis]
MEEILAPSVGILAGKSINESFHEFLCRLCGRQIMESFMSKESADYFDLLQEFESSKQSIRSDQRNFVRIFLPESLVHLVTKEHMAFEKIIEKDPYTETVRYRQNKLYVSPGIFRGLFERTIRKIIKHIETMLKDPKLKDINLIMMVGGFSGSKLMQDAMHTYFGRSKTVVTFNEPAIAVMKGAVMFALQAKVAKFTYGVKGWSDWDPNEHPESKKVIINGKRKCKDIFYKLLSKGDKLPKDLHVSTIMSVPNTFEDMFNCFIFVSTNLNPRYTTDHDCKEVLHIPVTVLTKDQDFEIDVGFIFEDWKTLVTVKNVNTRLIYEQYMHYPDYLFEKKQDVKLLQELRGLGIDNVSDLNELLNESSQKSCWNRIYLVGPYNVGKTCLAKVLVGETVPKTRQSTDGIWIYMGRAGMNVEDMKWVFFPKGNAIKEVLTNMLMSMAIEDTKPISKECDHERVTTPGQENSTNSDKNASTNDMHDANAAANDMQQDIAAQTELHDDKAEPTNLKDDKTNINQGISLSINYTDNASESQKVDTVNSEIVPTIELGETTANIDFDHEHAQRTEKSNADTKSKIFDDDVMSQEEEHPSVADIQSSTKDTQNFTSAAKRTFESEPKEIHITSTEQPPDVFETSFEKLTEHQESKQLSEKTATKQNILDVTHNSECEWLEEITTDMSHDKIHQLLVKAVQEGKYKQKIVPIDIWDFGGQKDYYMTHQLFITSRGIFVLMFNGSIDLHKNMPDLCFLPGHFGKPTVAVYLLHWVNSILTYCSRSKDGFPKIIFVATHKDTKWFEWTKEARRRKLVKDLQSLFKTHAGLDHLEFDPLIFVDATNPGDQEIAKLRSILMQRAIEHPRWGEAMPTKWIPLELQLAQKSEEGINIISRDQLKQLNSRNGDMVLSEKQLETFLKVHHSLGKLLYFDVGRLRDFIIISPAYLVEVLRSIVTERQFRPKEKIYSTIFEELQNNGRIERDAIFRLWQQEMFRHILPYKEYMLEILVHLDIIIAPSSSFEDITSSVQDVPSFLVPCMINKSNDTNFLGRFWKSNNSIILAYTFVEQVIPPALAYRFINYFVSGWKIKMYKEGNNTTQMLFSDLAVIELDICHDVAVQVRENRVIVSLIHAKTKDDIIPTLASSLQECLTVAIERISEFYSTLSEDIHQGQFNICVSSCPGLGKLEKEQSPLPQHIRRIASQISPEKCHDIALKLGLPESEWNDLEYQFQHQPPNDLKFMALWSCMLKRRHVTFDRLKDVLKNSELSGHLLCQVFRDVIPDIPENSKDSLNKIPSFNLLHELCNHIGTRIMQIAIELDIDIPTIQRIQQEHDKKPLEQTKEVFRRWRQRSSPKPTVLGLLKALDRIGIFGTTCSVVLQFAQE